MDEVHIETNCNHPNLIRYFERAAKYGADPDLDAVAELCRKMSGLGSCTADQLEDKIRKLTMPRGFAHARLFDARDSTQIGAIFADPGKVVPPVAIAVLVAVSPNFLEGRWVKTSALPSRDPGVLDLLLTFEKRLRPLELCHLE